MLSYDDYLSSKVADADPISWAEYKQNSRNAKDYPLVLLYQKDFDDGTLVVDKPAYLKLAEDVVFYPNRNDDLLPRPDQE